MLESTQTLPESWLHYLGTSDVSVWLASFRTSTKQAVSDLLWDAFYFGPLNLTERRQLLEGWLDRLGNADRFAEQLDEALTEWVKDNWGRFERDAVCLVSAWSCLCGVVRFSNTLSQDSALTNCTAALTARFPERQQFLGSFSPGPGAAPVGKYLAAVAEFQTNRELAPAWHNMCDLPDGVPFYHASYAMLGLR